MSVLQGNSGGRRNVSDSVKVVVAAFVLLLAGCAQPMPAPSLNTPTSTSSPAGGISADAAVLIARPHAGDDAVFVAVVAEHYQDVGTEDPSPRTSLDIQIRMVWAVFFDRQVVICPPNEAPCWPPRSGQTRVIIDYFTGAFVESSTSAPGAGGEGFDRQ